MSAFMCFQSEYFKAMRAKNPNLPMTEIAKLGGKSWNSLSIECKQPFINKHEEDIIRHKKEMAQFNKTGFFINAQGVKSSDMKKKKKRPSSSKQDQNPAPKKRTNKSASKKV